jgi:glycine C-acetyltransferase
MMPKAMPVSLMAFAFHPGHRYVFKHNDMEDCEKTASACPLQLIEKQTLWGILLITEGVFGMAGEPG